MPDDQWRKSMSQVEAIRRFSSLYVRKSRRGAAASAQEVDALFRIGLAGDSLTPLLLSQDMGVSKTIVSRLAENLTLGGYIQKQFNETDRRSYNLVITDLGREALGNLCREYLAPIVELKQKLGEESFDSLMRCIELANRGDETDLFEMEVSI